MLRRSIISIAGGVTLGAALPVLGQTIPRVYRVGLLSLYVRREIWPVMPALREIGYEEPRNLVFDYRYAEGNHALLPGMAAELVAAKPDVLLTVGSFEARALLRMTSSILIVTSARGPDPVQEGLVASLARPGANLTGVTGPPASVGAKALQLLREAVPGMVRVGNISEVELDSLVLYGHSRMPAAGNTRCMELQLAVVHAGVAREAMVHFMTFPGDEALRLARSTTPAGELPGAQGWLGLGDCCVSVAADWSRYADLVSGARWGWIGGDAPWERLALR